MATQRKIFRIEQINAQDAFRHVPPDESDSAVRHAEIMAAVNTLRALLETTNAPSMAATGTFDAEISEAKTLKVELDVIDEAIKRTRQELAKLHDGDFEGPTVKRAANELDAVVVGTETATGSILKSAEDIEQIVNTLGAGLKSDHERGMAQDIQDRVTRIFEACNFQDLTGQRITKVVATLKFVEAHIARMMQIWDGIERVKDHVPVSAPAPAPAKDHLLNGPKLVGDIGYSSQFDIDALFNQPHNADSLTTRTPD
ncbi:MAG: protein phosphatase CheZ [Rhizobiales bacterium]|nr:protein phosphatase CheZ [Hyphomicrobiales bacterium]